MLILPSIRKDGYGISNAIDNRSLKWTRVQVVLVGEVRFDRFPHNLWKHRFYLCHHLNTFLCCVEKFKKTDWKNCMISFKNRVQLKEIRSGIIQSFWNTFFKSYTIFIRYNAEKNIMIFYLIIAEITALFCTEIWWRSLWLYSARRSFSLAWRR